MPRSDDLVRRVTTRLAELRRKRRITQEALAELLDVPVQHVSRIEAGQNITLATLERIATALGLQVKVTFGAAAAGPRKPGPSRRQRAQASKTRRPV